MFICTKGVYTILADETKDCSKKEQLAIVLHYIDVEAVTIFQIKRMIQPSARNSILGIYGWIQLSASRH